ncbi:MAG: YjbE family putative metal transport protein [Ktedonobacterales bacterium]
MNGVVSIIALAGGIALLDIVLSGDNALVIGAAASRLQRGQRRFAIILGGAGAVVLRLVLATIATELLSIAYLQFAGGLILCVIAVRLLLPEGENRFLRTSSDHLLPAILTILLADVSMSLDNVIAVGALAHGNVPLLVIGVAFSMVLLFVASSVVAMIIDRMAWLIDVASLVLAWTAASLILEDPFVRAHVSLSFEEQLAVHLGAVAVLIVIDLALRLRRRAVERRVTSEEEGVLEGASQAPVEAAAPSVAAPEERSPVTSMPRPQLGPSTEE